jgi:hypothetical protein
MIIHYYSMILWHGKEHLFPLQKNQSKVMTCHTIFKPSLPPQISPPQHSQQKKNTPTGGIFGGLTRRSLVGQNRIRKYKTTSPPSSLLKERGVEQIARRVSHRVRILLFLIRRVRVVAHGSYRHSYGSSLHP